MQKEDIHFAGDGRCPQLSVGPIDPKPGPILPKDEADALKEVIISEPQQANNIEAIIKIKI